MDYLIFFSVVLWRRMKISIPYEIKNNKNKTIPFEQRAHTHTAEKTTNPKSKSQKSILQRNRWESASGCIGLRFDCILWHIDIVFHCVIGTDGCCCSMNPPFFLSVWIHFYWYSCVWSSSFIYAERTSIFIYFQYNCVMRWLTKCMDMHNAAKTRTES